MRVILSAMGRDMLIAGALAFATLALGIWTAPDLGQAAALAGAASIGAVIAVLRIVPLYLPRLTEALAARFGIAGGDAIVLAALTLVGAFVSLAIDVLSAPDLNTGRAIGTAGLLALGGLATRLVIGLLTKGETPSVTTGGVSVPPQPVAPASLPQPSVPTNL